MYTYVYIFKLYLSVRINKLEKIDQRNYVVDVKPLCVLGMESIVKKKRAANAPSLPFSSPLLNHLPQGDVIRREITEVRKILSNMLRVRQNIELFNLQL